MSPATGFLSSSGRRKSKISQNRRPAQEAKATQIKNIAKSSPRARSQSGANQEIRRIVAQRKKPKRRKSKISQNRRPAQDGQATQIKKFAESSPSARSQSDANQNYRKIVAQCGPYKWRSGGANQTNSQNCRMLLKRAWEWR
jgi:hypothetical protein